MEIHFAEYPDLETRSTVVVAYTMVGERKVCSRMYLSLGNHRKDYIDAAYNMLKDEVRRRALNEMRVQQIYDNAYRNVPEEPSPALVGFVQWGRRMMQRHVKPKEIHDWKKEGF